MVTGAPVNVKDFGAAGDGVADDTAAIVSAAATLQDNQTLYFPSGVYLVSAASATTHQSGAAYGKVVLALTGLSNITIQADSATIKVVDHNCSTGGLTFANFKACQTVAISGFNFDMTFTGVNTSASLTRFAEQLRALTMRVMVKLKTRSTARLPSQTAHSNFFTRLGSSPKAAHRLAATQTTGTKFIQFLFLAHTLPALMPHSLATSQLKIAAQKMGTTLTAFGLGLGTM
jgi:hypothetical protein